MLPRWWTPVERPGATELVVCVDAVEKNAVKECRHEGPGGGLSIYDATFEFSLFEARSGKKLASLKVPMKNTVTTCPAVKFDRDQEGRFPDYAQPLQAFVKPFVGGPE